MVYVCIELYSNVNQKLLLNNIRLILCSNEDNHKKSLRIASTLIYIQAQVALKFWTRVLTNMSQHLVLREFGHIGQTEVKI
jgi:hypothetical protein